LHLGDLIKGINVNMMDTNGPIDLNITGITCDSRQVQPGFLFAAMVGSNSNGGDFIQQAIDLGALAVLTSKDMEPIDLDTSTVLMLSDDVRHDYAKLASQFYGQQPETVVAVTGTNGKTSVAGFIRQIWQANGLPAASSGTMGIELANIDAADDLKTKYPSKLTTPDSVDLHKMLADLKMAGVDHLALEASSHGLDQCRLDGVRISTGVFTNLSRDHLDYHGDVATYLNAKLKLFDELIVDGGSAVIDMDDPFADDFIAAARGRQLRVLTYGVDGKDVQLLKQQAQGNHQALTLKVFGETMPCKLPLIGDFQISNALAALAAVLADSGDPIKSVKAVEKLATIHGRLELIGVTKSGAAVYIDYAHTPAALETVLMTLCDVTVGSVDVVFGCGGDRDTGKRRSMGEVAARLAARVYVTDDNPRFENAEKIRAEIMPGCKQAIEIADRRDAINQAINNLSAGDVLLIAGKGHETGQIVNGTTVPFNDADVVRDMLNKDKS